MGVMLVHSHAYFWSVTCVGVEEFVGGSRGAV